jgi:hypothetical protein
MVELMTMNKKTLLSFIRKDYALLCVITVGVVIIYFPITNDYFFADDFHHLLEAKLSTGLLTSLFVATNEHLHPLFRLVFAGEFYLFGLNPAGYYAVNILLHAINIVLIAYLYRSLTGDRVGALCAALLFGVTASHWRTVMWITTSGQLLASFWFLIATISFIAYTRNKSFPLLVVASFSHLFMLLSFSSGLELPLLYFIYLVLVGRGDRKVSLKDMKCLFPLMPFVINDIMYLFLRKFVVPAGAGIIDAGGGV